jgi:hypothetical protein
MTDPLGRGEPARTMTADAGGQSYEFVLRGEIGDRFGLLFEGMRLERTTGHTVLTGAVHDQAQLLGLIERIQELGIELVSVNPQDEP